MKDNQILNLIFTVNKSYHNSFKDLTKEELTGLCQHSSFLAKVREELLSEVSSKDLDVF